MNLSDVVHTSTVVASTSSRGKKVELLADVLRRLAPNETAIAIGFLTGWPRQGKLGIGELRVGIHRSLGIQRGVVIRLFRFSATPIA